MSESLEELFLFGEEKMEKAIAQLKREFAAVRTGRANPAVLDKVLVEYYGAPTPLRQLSQVSVQDGTTLVIAAVLEFTAGKGGTKFENGILKISRKRFGAVILAFAAVFGIVAATQGINIIDTNPITQNPVFRDKSIAYTDGFYRLYIVNSPGLKNDDSLWKIGVEKLVIWWKTHKKADFPQKFSPKPKKCKFSTDF